MTICYRAHWHLTSIHSNRFFKCQFIKLLKLYQEKWRLALHDKIFKCFSICLVALASESTEFAHWSSWKAYKSYLSKSIETKHATKQTLNLVSYMYKMEIALCGLRGREYICHMSRLKSYKDKETQESLMIWLDLLHNKCTKINVFELYWV